MISVFTLYHTIPTFNDPELKVFENNVGKRENACSFPTMFSSLSKTKVIILATFNFSSANGFSLDQSRILSFGKELK